jgi:hypothetical protein
VAVTLHRCPLLWMKVPFHPCWVVQRALSEAGVEFAVQAGPLRRSARHELMARTGQALYPAVELEDGRIVREESGELARRIREGRLYEAPARLYTKTEH